MGDLKTAAIMAGTGAFLKAGGETVYTMHVTNEANSNFGIDTSFGGYTKRAIGHAGVGALGGLGIYGMLNSSNKKVSTALLGIGTGLGAIKGIYNQIYASQHYNSPEYGPGKAEANLEALVRSGGAYAIKGAMVGSGIYGSYEVAKRIAKGVM